MTTGKPRMMVAQMWMERRRLLRAVLTICAVAGLGAIVASAQEYLFSVNKGIELFGRVYREITVNYVDDLDPQKFMEAGIDGMLKSLDPYTVYITKEDGDEVDLLTNGSYGGIGVTIGLRDGAVQVITVMDGYSAQRQGIIAGDRIIQVDSVRVEAKSVNEIRGLTRGSPGTEVRVVIEREGESRPLEFVLVREEIRVKNVTFAGLLEPGIGYIRLERFSRLAGEEVRQALRDIKLQGPVTGLVLDLRGNPGGLLEAAVDVVGKFVPRGSLVVSTKGRRQEAERTYRSDEEPLLPAGALVVLTDRGSASASEIVAGSLQDMDRAVIVGERTFGKGLVQTILPLDYDAQLKITTARYYIPSGRSIQEIDYMHRDREGVFLVTPDSLKKEFRTSRGRKVFEHGGIAPDSTVADADDGPMVRDLYRKSLFFRFVNGYVARHPADTTGRVTDAMMAEFKAFLEAQKFDFQEDSEQRIKELRANAEASHYGTEVLEDLDRLAGAFAAEKTRAFERYREEIAGALGVELAARLKGEKGRIVASLPSDRQFQVALGIVKNPAVYARIMSR